jgi:hypothetical protein
LINAVMHLIHAERRGVAGPPVTREAVMEASSGNGREAARTSRAVVPPPVDVSRS